MWTGQDRVILLASATEQYCGGNIGFYALCGKILVQMPGLVQQISREHSAVKLRIARLGADTGWISPLLRRHVYTKIKNHDV